MGAITAKMVQELRERTGLGMMQCKKALTETEGDIDKAVEVLRKAGAAVAAKKASREAKEGKILLGSSNGITAAVEINCETDFVSSSDGFGEFSGTVLKAILDNKPADMDTLKKSKVGEHSVETLNEQIIGKIGENIAIKRFVLETSGEGELVEVYSHMGGKIGVICKFTFQGSASHPDKLSEAAKDICMQIAAMNPLAVRPEEIDENVIAKEKEIFKEQVLKEGKPEAMADKIVLGKMGRFYKDNCLLQQPFVKDSKQTIEKFLTAVGKEQGVESLTVASFHRLQLGQ